MAEEKPFDPTPARVARAKREGDVARSQDLNAVAALACASLGLAALMPALSTAARNALIDAAVGTVGLGPYAALAGGALAIVACALGGAVAATYLQTRTLAVRFPSPAFAKLDPFAGVRRMCSRDTVVAGAKALAVSCAVSAALAPLVRRAFAGSSGVEPARLAAAAQSALVGIVASALAVAAAFAVADVALERRKWRRRLRMSFDELKRDHKQSEGDPALKGRRRTAHRTLVRGSIARVADAAFVVANPTHVAIALEYRPPDVAVPRVIVRAIDEGARAVKRRARELRVPIVDDVRLARALLATTRVGECIAPDLYGAVAAIVAALAHEGVLG